MRYAVRAGLVVAVAVLTACGAWAADPPARVKPVVAGPLVLNPRDVIAVYRPAGGQSVGILIGRPGRATQTIVLNDFREATAAFNELWNNAEVVKDPGETDARPLTRMLIKGAVVPAADANKDGGEGGAAPADKRVGTLILNVDRVLAIAWDTEQRVAHVYVDRAVGDGAANEQTVVISKEEADLVIAAFRACSVAARP